MSEVASTDISLTLPAGSTEILNDLGGVQLMNSCLCDDEVRSRSLSYGRAR